ncbi:MAG TPA: hypothetical protein VFO10_25385 [Oligoflexus sp.]|uniref:hypothetical protein n=1 Tax=Oligoflexus sp. TaxID=1971216 RepID=UPI002D801A01|nr:hypothetical protein [Oligoflexus sp.]HET9240623.1 hypothetical protein [Oligoflexus sp.]
MQVHVIGLGIFLLVSCNSSINQTQSVQNSKQFSCIATGEMCLQYRYQPDDAEVSFLQGLCKGRALNMECDRKYYNLDCKKDIHYQENNRSFNLAIFEHKPEGGCTSPPFENEWDGLSNDTDPSKPGAFLK